MRLLRYLLFLPLILINGMLLMSQTDPHSFARPKEAVVTHVEFDLVVDFKKKQLSGTARLTLERSAAAAEVWLDTRELDIREVILDDGTKAIWHLGDEQPWLGRPLRISLKPATQSVTVRYSTTPESAAVQWLKPEQTEGKKHPFLFTQGQAILSRTWLPVQDSPGIRFTWEATVRVPEELMAVMSGSNPQEKSGDGVYHFRMNQPVPAYLVALAVGELEFRSLGDRTGVYAEPVMVKRAAFELADTEKMLVTAEKLYGTYQWGRYDIIVLPPSFPFGGMENPRLTFATPTIIAGDRSLTSLIAHELAHSWSGNLVTNATWDDFWLNEGFTVYFERRIMEVLYGKSYADMLALLGYQDLKETIAGLEADPKDTHLKLALKERDPDDGMTDIAYEKGYFFLRSLEEAVGRDAFDRFLKKYFREFAFRGIDTEKFVKYLNRQLGFETGKTFNEKQWIYEPGLPDNCPVPVSERFAEVDVARTAFMNGKTKARSLPVKTWSTHEWLHFIRHLPDGIEVRLLQQLDDTYDFTHSGNAEIQAAWFLRVIPSEYTASDEALKEFLMRVGRRKFVVPLYKSMLQSQRLAGTARAAYRIAKPGYHAVTVQTLDALFSGK